MNKLFTNILIYSSSHICKTNPISNSSPLCSLRPTGHDSAELVEVGPRDSIHEKRTKFKPQGTDQTRKRWRFSYKLLHKSAQENAKISQFFQFSQICDQNILKSCSIKDLQVYLSRSTIHERSLNNPIRRGSSRNYKKMKNKPNFTTKSNMTNSPHGSRATTRLRSSKSDHESRFIQNEPNFNHNF